MSNISVLPRRLWQSSRLGLLGERIAALRNLVYRSPLYRVLLQAQLPEISARAPADPWPANAARGVALQRGAYVFAGQEIVAVGGLPWFFNAASPTWIEEAHGFEWLRDLRAEGTDHGRETARALVSDWIAHCGAWHPQVWRPDILGRRLIAWLAHADYLREGTDIGFERWFIGSLGAQAGYLARTASASPGGAAQFAAATGLLYSGLYLSDGDRRLSQALRCLERAVVEQVGVDGCHIERSPSAHLRALRDLIVARDALQGAGKPVSKALSDAIGRMARVLLLFRHGDGGLALFNDSIEEDPRLIDAALRGAGELGDPVASASEAGFERLAAGDTLVLLDAGMPPPAEMSRRSHAGLLSFEMSDGPARLIVNCGAQAGHAAQWGSALRATAAHSTLTLDNTNAIGFADDGTVSRYPGNVTYNRHDENGNIWIEAGHDGYRENFGTRHERRLYLNTAGDNLRGEDNMCGRAGLPFVLRFHLHPAVVAQVGDEGVLLRHQHGSEWRFRAAGGTIGVNESIYMGRLGESQRTEQIVIRGTTAEEKTTVKWALTRLGETT